MCVYASPCQTAGEKRRLNTKCQLTGSFPNYQVSEIQEEQPFEMSVTDSRPVMHVILATTVATVTPITTALASKHTTSN